MAAWGGGRWRQEAGRERERQGLTARERQVLEYIAAGRSNKVVAIDLGISMRTVEKHRARIFNKLGVRNAVELVHSWYGVQPQRVPDALIAGGALRLAEPDAVRAGVQLASPTACYGTSAGGWSERSCAQVYPQHEGRDAGGLEPCCCRLCGSVLPAGAAPSGAAAAGLAPVRSYSGNAVFNPGMLTAKKKP